MVSTRQQTRCFHNTFFFTPAKCCSTNHYIGAAAPYLIPRNWNPIPKHTTYTISAIHIGWPKLRRLLLTIFVTLQIFYQTATGQTSTLLMSAAHEIIYLTFFFCSCEWPQFSANKTSYRLSVFTFSLQYLFRMLGGHCANANIKIVNCVWNCNVSISLRIRGAFSMTEMHRIINAAKIWFGTCWIVGCVWINPVIYYSFTCQTNRKAFNEHWFQCSIAHKNQIPQIPCNFIFRSFSKKCFDVMQSKL